MAAASASNNRQSAEAVYDLAIIGGGIVGAAILYLAARYSALGRGGRIALFEKYSGPAPVNSHRDQNSQTLHFGDIETNYSLAKARTVKAAASLLKIYLERVRPPAFRRLGKMVLAVGEQEVKELAARYENIKNDFPWLRKLTREEIADREPKVVLGRDPEEPLLALATECYAVDFGAVAASFVKQAQDATRPARRQARPPDLFFNTEIISLKNDRGEYELRTSRGCFHAKTVVVAAGPMSLVFAKRLGYGKDLGILPVAGNFYRATNILRGKVYMMQIPDLPFAAIHGDPDVHNPAETRFGPTIRVLPLLERHRYQSIWGFLRTSVWNPAGVMSLIKITFRPVILRYVLKNILYDLPFVGSRLFVRWELRKIVPTISAARVEWLRGRGGIRPQVINATKGEMEFGEAEIVGDRIIFAITPSPGASVCLDYARNVLRKIANFLGPGAAFDEIGFRKDFSEL